MLYCRYVRNANNVTVLCCVVLYCIYIYVCIPVYTLDYMSTCCHLHSQTCVVVWYCSFTDVYLPQT